MVAATKKNVVAKEGAEEPAKRGPGRPPLPDHLKKTKKVPSGKPRGRPKGPAKPKAAKAPPPKKTSKGRKLTKAE